MQSALRQASRRAASAAGRRGVATEAERERVALLVQQEVRAQMRRAAREAEALAFLRARAEAEVVAAIYLKEGVKMGFAFLGGAYATMLYALYRAAA